MKYFHRLHFYFHVIKLCIKRGERIFMKDDPFLTSVCIRLINCFKESDAQEETNQMTWRLFIL